MTPGDARVPYDYRNCQSLFGYAEKVHERSGGICQLCGCGGEHGVDFDLWRQLTVEHLIGEKQGGYASQIKVAVEGRFPQLSPAEQSALIQAIDQANTITACSFCNSTTSRDQNDKSMTELIGEAQGGPSEVLQAVTQALGIVHVRKRQAVQHKIRSVRAEFDRRVAPTLADTRERKPGASACPNG